MSGNGDGAARILVAGIGNIFLGDDGFGVETVRRLAREDLPPHVEVADIGVRGVHLAYQVLDGWDVLVLVDAVGRGAAPGTLHLIDATADRALPGGAGVPLDGHRMTPGAVLALLDTLCAGTGATPPRRIALVGCEPACLDEGIGLSPQVAAAVPGAVRMVTELVDRESALPSPIRRTP
ncbi:hydrogenase maturation protease [Streptomyces zhihengii]